jgi:putative endonuclease
MFRLTSVEVVFYFTTNLQAILMNWTVYILECSDQTLYTGITNDLIRRVAQHNAGQGAKYTRGRAPLKLVYRESCEDKSQALRREIQIKALSRAKKIELITKV